MKHGRKWRNKSYPSAETKQESTMAMHMIYNHG